MNDLRRLLRLVPIALALAYTGCGSDELTSPAAPAHTLAVSPDKLVMGVGMSRQLSVKVLDEVGGEIPGAAVNFVSSDPGRASVSSSGLVTYTGVGLAAIRVSSSGLLTVVPYHGLGSGHPLGTTTTTARLPGDGQGDGPFGVAVDAEGHIFISQTNSGRVASSLYPATDFVTGDLGGGTPTSIALLGHGTALVTPSGPDTNDASVIDLATEKVLTQVTLDVPAFSAITAPDSQTAYLGTNDGRVLVFDVASSTVTGSIDLGVPDSRANHLAFNSGGTLLYASSFTTGTISEIDVASRSVARLLIVGGEPQGLALSPDGNALFLADEAGTGTIKVLDLVRNVVAVSIPSGATSGIGGPFGLAMSPDGSAVYVGVINNNGPGLIQVIDAGSKTIARTIESCGHTPRRIAFGFSGGLAVITDESGCATFVE
jgi:DNA-binding beta-propeller fold protein YncE